MCDGDGMGKPPWYGSANGWGKDTRFQPGNKAAVGHKPNRRSAELKAALMACVTDDDIKDIYRSMLVAAKGGDVAAARLLWDRSMGKETMPVEVSTPDEPLNGGRILNVLADACVAELAAEIGEDRAKVAVAAAFDRLAAGVRDGRWPEGYFHEIPKRVIILPDNGMARKSRSDTARDGTGRNPDGGLAGPDVTGRP
jgi:hypothetical protein